MVKDLTKKYLAIFSKESEVGLLYSIKTVVRQPKPFQSGSLRQAVTLKITQVSFFVTPSPDFYFAKSLRSGEPDLFIGHMWKECQGMGGRGGGDI